MCTKIFLQMSDFPHVDNFKCFQVLKIKYLKIYFFPLSVCVCVCVCVHACERACVCALVAGALSMHLVFLEARYYTSEAQEDSGTG